MFGMGLTGLSVMRTMAVHSTLVMNGADILATCVPKIYIKDMGIASVNLSLKNRSTNESGENCNGDDA
jgi:hypothetical protein